MPTIRLSPPQVELLTDIATHDEYYVRAFSRWAKTAGALVRRGLAVCQYDRSDWTTVRITAAGRQQALQRGLVANSAEEGR
jgi:hypothetical protein